MRMKAIPFGMVGQDMNHAGMSRGWHRKTVAKPVALESLSQCAGRVEPNGKSMTTGFRAQSGCPLMAFFILR